MNVAVYWNLHKRVFSLQSRERPTYGRVVGHRNDFFLYGVLPVVRERGRQKVIETGIKNVHAFLVGSLGRDSDDVDQELISSSTERGVLRYNPYINSHFVNQHGVDPLYLDLVHCSVINGHPRMEYWNWRYHEV